MDALTFILCCFLISELDSAFGEVVGRHLQFDFVAREDLDVVHPHLAGDMGRDDESVLQLHPEHGIGQCLDDGAVLLYGCLFRHIVYFFPSM